MNTLEEILEHHEGFRSKPYKDTVGKLTIGIGRNISDRGISRVEAEFLFANDIELSRTELQANLHWFDSLDPVRQAVLIDMHFNMGWPVLSRFKNTLALIKSAEYKAAAIAMLHSKWATQVGKRAVRLSEMMRTGEWPKE
jgi:lysozyme